MNEMKIETPWLKTDSKIGEHFLADAYKRSTFQSSITQGAFSLRDPLKKLL